MEFVMFLNLILTLQAVRCDTTQDRDSIVGGDEATIEDHPYQVSIQYGGSHTCGGAIITLSHVLTAGHCGKGYLSAFLSIRVGTSLLQTGGEQYDVQKITIHPNYHITNRRFDCAILQTRKEIKLSNKVAIIPMPQPDEDLQAGRMALASGWGASKEGGLRSNHLLKVEVPTISNDQCTEYYAHADLIIYPEMLCAGYANGEKDSCQGDSGGPLVQPPEGNTRQLIGIVSWGVGCARPRRPGVHTRISAVRNWIKEVAGI